TIEIPTTSISFPWYNPRVYSSLADARIAGIWSYPSNVEERARCAVFRDLSEKGYYMGSGLKFGGDWLVYPGDPLRYHSHFVATVFSRPTSTLRPIDVVAFGRLGTATRKTHLLCGYDDETGIVDYYSIEWAGFG
ncbi:tRNA intron endonuclease, partial [Cantharellus anzutake]|uniref:tRNA intron endonuclease n=1 Tax=Cantharellus anzutake TaxID=1750568 RepID=UPI0019071BD2